METHQSRRATILALIISLLVHGIILFLLTNNLDIITFIKDEILLEKLHKRRERWAATKARASQFGAPVIFVDEPNITPQTASEENKSEENKTQEQSLQEIETEKTDPEPTTVAKHIAPQESPKQQKTDLKKLQKKLAKKMQLSHKLKQIKQARKTQPRQPTKEKKLTLAQLTQGFLDHLKNEGRHNVEMRGKRGMPTAEQLKHERYIEKLSWCLQNSFKINREKCPASKAIQTNAEVLLELNNNGSIKNLRMIKSSGNRMLDQFTLFIFRDASTSFPPVPHYLPHNPYHIVYIIEIDTIMNRSFGIYR